MRTSTTLIALALTACGGAEEFDTTEDEVAVPIANVAPTDGLRVMTFNILHGALGLQNVADAIRAADPDIVHLQEVDVGAQRSGFVDQPAVLAQLTGLRHHAFDSVLDLSPGQYGTAFLSRHPIQPVLRHVLPGGLHPRHLFVVDADTRLGVRRIGGTHLTFVGHLQPPQVIDLLLTAHEAHVEMVLGDFNFEPTSPLFSWMQWLYADAWSTASQRVGPSNGWTFPANTPTRRIDYVFVQQGVSRAEVPSVVASDHRALVVDLN